MSFIVDFVYAASIKLAALLEITLVYLGLIVNIKIELSIYLQI